MKFTSFLLSSLAVAALFGKATALDFTINTAPTVAADFSLAIPTVTATYGTVTNDGNSYDEAFFTVVGSECTATPFAQIETNTAFDSSLANTVVTVAKITDVEVAEVAGAINYCHKLSAKDGNGNVMFVRDTIITITIEMNGVAFTVTGLSATEAVTGGSTGTASGSGTTTAVANPLAVPVGTTFTLTIANDAPTLDVSTVQTLKITPSGGSEQDWIVGGAVAGAYTNYLPTPVCDTANCVLTFQLPFSYFLTGGAMTMTGTVNLVTTTGTRRLQEGANSAGEGSFTGEVGLIAPAGNDESSAPMSVIGGALVAAHAIMVLAM